MIRRAGAGRRPVASPPGRDYHTATLLPSGKVLVAGGFDIYVNSLASAELYDPAAGKLERRLAAWSLHTVITRRRCCPTARCWSQPVIFRPIKYASAELYDPASGTWSGDRHPRHRTRVITRRRCCPTARCLSLRSGPPARNSTMSASDSAATGSLISPRPETHREASISCSPAGVSKASRKLQAATLRIHRAITPSCSCAASITARLLSFPSIQPKAGRTPASVLCR